MRNILEVNLQHPVFPCGSPPLYYPCRRWSNIGDHTGSELSTAFSRNFVKEVKKSKKFLPGSKVSKTIKFFLQRFFEKKLKDLIGKRLKVKDHFFSFFLAS